MSFRTKFGLVVISATISLYAIVGGLLPSRAQPQDNPSAQLRIFESVLLHIQNDYVDEPNMDKVRAGALRGLANGLDPYSTYLTVEQVKEVRTGAPRESVGVGAELSQVSSYLYVVAPVKGGPADLAGVKAGDIIEYIDNRATRDISLHDAKQLLNGTAGSEVKLRILRSNTRPMTVSVRRLSFRTPAAEARMETGKIGVIRVNSLADGEGADVKARLNDLMKQGAQKILLDLRSVAGGSLNEGVAVANLFIKDGPLAQTIGRENKTLKTFSADPKLHVFSGQLAALIDGGTAGAAEIVASAIIESKRGDVVGEKSFGAGTEQQLFTLRDGDGLLLTIIKWASGSGKPFLGEDRQKSGVSPSVEVKRPESADSTEPDDLAADDEAEPKPSPGAKTEPAPPKPQPEDTQMKKALELLREKPASQRIA